MRKQIKSYQMRNHLSPRISLAILAAMIGTASAMDLDEETNEDFKLTANDAGADDQFGWSVAIDGNIAGVGAIADNGRLGSAYLFNASSGVQLFKLTHSDPIFLDSFGLSIAIDDNMAAVGAPLHGHLLGSEPGAVYLFDVTTGTQLRKLLPNDGGLGDSFGFSVDIDNGIVAVGSYLHDDNGDKSGAVYLFNASTGAQTRKLLPNDGAEDDEFGRAVAMDGGIVAVGAHYGDDNGSNSGVVYLFNAATGTQLRKLLPDDGVANDDFGWSVAIANGVVAVGATGDDDNGNGSGSAYLFNATTGAQLFKLLPDDGATDDGFGASISIDSEKVVVGADFSDYFGFASGAAYLFDVITGEQKTKLVPNEGNGSEYFGFSIAIHDGNIVVGVPDSREGADRPGAAYTFLSDRDEDGLPDLWESNGIDVNGDSIIDLDLRALGAKPDHKDIFLEIDAMTGRAPSEKVLNAVKEAFRDAPVTNLDGVGGIKLHAEVDDDDISLRNYPRGFIDFDIDKDSYFGSLDDRTDPNNTQILEAKRLVYRYCIFANGQSDTATGQAEIGGNDLMVTLGLLRDIPGGPPDDQAGTLMHELGHTIGLRHGGGDSIKYKPNYFSVMNYTWQRPTAGWDLSWRLDYSEVKLPTLDESSLMELAGIGANYPGDLVPHFNGTGASLAPMDNGAPVNWNNMRGIEAKPVQVDINRYLPKSPPSPDQILHGYNDWANVDLRFRNSDDFADGVHDNVPDGEMTNEIIEALESLFPPDACPADLNDDGVLDIADVQEFLNLFATGDLTVDFAADGVLNFFDVQAYLKLFSIGCP
jgi:FG-GAP repeat protein